MTINASDPQPTGSDTPPVSTEQPAAQPSASTGEPAASAPASSATGEPAGGTPDAKWFDALGEDLKTNEAVIGHDSVDALIKEFIALKDGQRTVPAELADYGIEDLEMAGKYKDMGLDVSQAKEVESMLQNYGDHVFTDFERQLNEKVDSDIAELNKKTEAFFNTRYQGKAEETRQAMFNGVVGIVDQEYVDDVKEFIANPYTGSHPGFIAICHALKERVAPDAFEFGSGGAAQGPKKRYPNSDMNP